MQKIFKQEPQDIMTSKMLSGLDDRKMSTSWGNVISIVDKPKDMYGKTMSMKDELMPQYFELATALSPKEVKQIEKDSKNPRDIKAQLAKEIVSLYHGEKAAEKAAKEFVNIFKEKKLPNKVPIFKTSRNQINILDLLKKTGLVPSKSEARRLILQKGIKIDDKTCENWEEDIGLKEGMVIQVGKRKFIKIQKN